ncbi:hypothetical protein MAL01_02950 [Leptospira noguchii]|uniref:hypothetical protein n=1 Tax=Leptospira noguchii TaxID=28182 RepID=UPI001FB581B0|nr:hypothetical protein [Leptospira noguchii]UOG31070.1 hypothetical protein MAL06_03120 [Leptospira noguchii]UOG46873.1 hypothetical protein MAL01_02950 [Leptospira noguchii]
MERKELNETLFTKAFETQHNAFLWVALTQRLASIGARQVVSQSTMKFASCDDDPGNSVNAYLWVGVQGVVALSLLFAPIFLRRTHVNKNRNFRICP